jgi:hypothetical protein
LADLRKKDPRGRVDCFGMHPSEALVSPPATLEKASRFPGAAKARAKKM